MHRNYATCIISCVDCLGISMHKCMETPRGILPVNSNLLTSLFIYFMILFPKITLPRTPRDTAIRPIQRSKSVVSPVCGTVEVGVGVAVASGTAVTVGVAVAAGVTIASGVAVTAGVTVTSGVTVASGVAVTAGVTVASGVAVGVAAVPGCSRISK